MQSPLSLSLSLALSFLLLANLSPERIPVTIFASLLEAMFWFCPRCLLFPNLSINCVVMQVAFIKFGWHLSSVGK